MLAGLIESKQTNLISDKDVNTDIYSYGSYKIWFTGTKSII